MPDLEEQAQLEESPTSTEQDDAQDLDEGQLDQPDEQEDAEDEEDGGQAPEKAFSDRLKQARQKDLQAERDRVKAELEPQGFTLDDTGKVVPLTTGEFATTEATETDEEPPALQAYAEHSEKLLGVEPAALAADDVDRDDPLVQEWFDKARREGLDPDELTAADWRGLIRDEKRDHTGRMAQERQAQVSIRATIRAMETEETYKLPSGEWKPPNEEARKLIAATLRRKHGEMQQWGMTPSQIQAFMPTIAQAAIGANIASLATGAVAMKDVRSQTPPGKNGGQNMLTTEQEAVRQRSGMTAEEAKKYSDPGFVYPI